MVSTNNIAVEAGETIEITITVRNVGTDAAHNAFTVASASAESPFGVEFLNNSNSVTRLAANQQTTMQLRITVDSNAEAGSNHEIRLDHYFRDAHRHSHDSSDTIHVRILGEVGEPSIFLSGFQMVSGVLSPNQTFTVNAHIQNTGNREARDVRVSPISTGDIFFVGDQGQLSFGTVAPGQTRQLEFTFQTNQNIESGSFPLAFIVSYRDENGNHLEDEPLPFFVHVYAPDEDTIANLEIRNMSAPTATLHVGRTEQVTFVLYNIGDSEVRNIQVQAHPEDGLVPMSLDTIVVPVLAPGQGFPMSFSFMAEDTARTRTHTIRFNISDSDDLSFNRFAAISVFNPDEEDDEDERFQIPRIIISEFSIYPQMPRAGQDFDLSITFRNTNSALSVNNIRITLEAMEHAEGHGSVFVPVGGSNTVFIDFLAPGAEVTKNLRFFTVPDADPRSYRLLVDMHYQDAEMREHRAEEQLSVSVAQVTRLEAIWMRDIPDFASVGDMIFFEFRATNTGRVDLSNVRVRMEAPWDTGEAGMFIGPLRAQTAMTFSGRFTPLEEGEFPATVIIYGEDATGAIVEYVHEFTLTVGGGFVGGDWDGAWGDDYWGDDDRHFGDWDEPAGFWNEYGEWVYFDNDGDGFFAGVIDFIRRPIVLIVAGVIVAAGVGGTIGLIMYLKKRASINFDDEDEDA